MKCKKCPNEAYGRSGLCKPCKNEYNKEWYQKNKDRHKASVAKNNRHYKERIQILKQVPCADCLKTLNPWQMDFDHLPQYVKEFDVSTAANVSLKRFLAEVEKCEVVCKNCHADRTHHRYAHKHVVRPKTQQEWAQSVYSFPCAYEWCDVE